VVASSESPPLQTQKQGDLYQPTVAEDETTAPPLTGTGDSSVLTFSVGLSQHFPITLYF